MTVINVRLLELLWSLNNRASRLNGFINNGMKDNALDEVNAIRDILDKIVRELRPPRNRLRFHQKLVLEALAGLPPKALTGQVYTQYKLICSRKGCSPLSIRRVSQIIEELSQLGFLEYQVISLGRYGRSKIITLRNNNGKPSENV